ncbi:PREDICTED: heterogeneous nuclear ribonucleoprotein A3 homolog 2-like isoform X2 [Dufourea novaeangliae]|uniref:heterogeneous nuclear ribonucleoprotein A3 homolog 2-like isoform X2 n=1 Tax=Dufourea novaeangliae TaxID=178035 RepID=UPI000767181A|nr:PREDICTED: heterogeneous nuclear ribonucleoprotein A3 homolog 2-like isoform X2 [Dufourea novaeangliae]
MTGETSWCFRTLSVFLFITALSALPTPESTTDVVSDAEDTTLSTELKPPPIPEKEDHQYVLFVINLYGLKNSSGETSDETFENEIISKVPELAGPLATVFLVIEVDDDDEETNVPVDLDEVADDFEHGEGFNVERINHDGETKLLRVKLDKSDADMVLPKSKMETMTKVRNRRSPCLKCKLKGYGHNGGYGGGGGGGFGGGYGGEGGPGGGYNGGCGSGNCGGGYPSGGYPSGGYYPNQGGGCGGGGCGGGVGYPSHPTYPSGGGCSTCGGGGHNGYGGGGGGGNSYAQASAQASAQSWGK